MESNLNRKDQILIIPFGESENYVQDTSIEKLREVHRILDACQPYYTLNSYNGPPTQVCECGNILYACYGDYKRCEKHLYTQTKNVEEWVRTQPNVVKLILKNHTFAYFKAPKWLED